MNLIRVSQTLTVNQGSVKTTVNGTGKLRGKNPLEILIPYAGFKTEHHNPADRVSLEWVMSQISIPTSTFFFFFK